VVSRHANHRHGGRFWPVALAILILASAAHAKEKPPGFESPDQAFHAYVTGAVTGDFDLMLSTLTRESRAYHVGLAVMSLTYVFHGTSMRRSCAITESQPTPR
jgi:hypothetical protein